MLAFTPGTFVGRGTAVNVRALRRERSRPSAHVTNSTRGARLSAHSSRFFPFDRTSRYAILSPYTNGNTTGNYRGRSQFSQMVVIDLTEFSVDGVSVVDLAATSRQQVCMRTWRQLYFVGLDPRVPPSPLKWITWTQNDMIRSVVIPKPSRSIHVPIFWNDHVDERGVKLLFWSGSPDSSTGY